VKILEQEPIHRSLLMSLPPDSPSRRRLDFLVLAGRRVLPFGTSSGLAGRLCGRLRHRPKPPISRATERTTGVAEGAGDSSIREASCEGGTVSCCSTFLRFSRPVHVLGPHGQGLVILGR
jgi:hypothetical protein